jgi:hypothetical protein
MATAALQASRAAGASKLQAVPHSALLLPAHDIVGGVVSTVVTVWLQVLALPQLSVALQVRVALKVPSQKPL